MYLKLFHLSVFVLNLYALWYDQAYVVLPLKMWENVQRWPLKGRFIFMTHLGCVLQTIYFGTAFLNDLIGTNAASPKKPPLIRKIKDLTYGQAFSNALYVTATFWILYFIDKDLIYPDEINKVIPQWLNHTLHTMVAVFIFIEMFVSNKNYPSQKTGLKMVLAFTLAYTVLQHALYFTTGRWAYPFVELFNWVTRTLFIIFNIFAYLVLYVAGEKLNCLLLPKVDVGNKKSH